MNKLRELNWPVILIWLSLSIIGLFSIYSATQGPVAAFLPEYIKSNFTKQLVWIFLSIIVLIGIQFTTPRTFQAGSYIFYILALLLTTTTLIFGVEISGAKSWLNIGSFRLQPSELMKIATILAVANYLTSRRNISAENIKSAVGAVFIILVPALVVLLQNDLGTALVFLFLIPVILFWSGLPNGISLFMISPALIIYATVINWYWGLIAAVVITITIFFLQRRPWLTFLSFFTGIFSVIGVQVALFQILKPHQVARIYAFVNPAFDPSGAGWNVIQAKTAIGSGGFWGKGFLQGTQTQLRFLPEQWTDFIFCVIAEESGFLGASLTILLFFGLFIFLLKMAASHKYPFAQLAIVGVTSVFFFHFFINVGSATGLVPVIGLPLPFVSYGGSALLTNTLMLALCLNMDLYSREFSIYS